MEELIKQLELYDERREYGRFIQTYETTSRDAIEAFLEDEEDILNFFDLVIIAYVETGNYDMALRYIEPQIHRCYRLKEAVGEDFNSRMQFYTLFLSWICRAKKNRFSEFISIKYYLYYGGEREDMKKDYEGLIIYWKLCVFYLILTVCAISVFDSLFIHLINLAVKWVLWIIIVVYQLLYFYRKSVLDKIVVSTLGVLSSIYSVAPIRVIQEYIRKDVI